MEGRARAAQPDEGSVRGLAVQRLTFTRTPKLDGERARPGCCFPRPRGKPGVREIAQAAPEQACPIRVRDLRPFLVEAARRAPPSRQCLPNRRTQPTVSSPSLPSCARRGGPSCARRRCQACRRRGRSRERPGLRRSPAATGSAATLAIPPPPAAGSACP